MMLAGRRASDRVAAAFLSAIAVGAPVPAGATLELSLNLDYPTLALARETRQQALETVPAGQARSWAVDGIATGAIEPLRTWKSTSGHWCREYRESLRLADGRSQTIEAIRCRDANGRWRKVEGG